MSGYGMLPALASLLIGLPAFAADIRLPLADGHLVIKDAQFIRHDDFWPELRFTAVNETGTFWNWIELQIEVDGACDSMPRHWSFPAKFALGWAEGRRMTKEYIDTIIPLVEKVGGCETKTIRIRIISAANLQVRINGVTGETIDLKAEAAALQAKRDAELAARERTQAEEKAAAAAKRADDEEAERKEIAVSQRKAAAAGAAVRKREADRVARLAKLPWVDSGSLFAFFASDRKCAQQFGEAVLMDGLEKRKRISDLVAYGCGFIADSPVHVELVRNDNVFALVRLAAGKEDGRSGWVPVLWMK